MKDKLREESVPELITITREDGTTYEVTEEGLAEIMESEDYFTLPTDRSLEGLAAEVALKSKRE